MPSGQAVPNAYSNRSGTHPAGPPEGVKTSASAHATQACAAASTAAASAAGITGAAGSAGGVARSDTLRSFHSFSPSIARPATSARKRRLPASGAGGRRRDRIRRAEGGGVLAETAGGQHALELLPEAHAHPRGRRGVDVVGLDERLQRHGGHGVVPRAGRGTGTTGPQLGQRRDGRAHLRDDRAASVVRRELAELPLAAEQPQRIMEARLQAGGELAVTRGGLEPCPACRLARHQRAVTRPRSVVTVSAAGAAAR